jgi:hypothetical protein
VLDRSELDRLWAWCRSAEGWARARAALGARTASPLTADLLQVLGASDATAAGHAAEATMGR